MLATELAVSGPLFYGPAANSHSHSVVMIIRVYALYGRSARVLWWLIGIAACLTGLTVVCVQAVSRSRKIYRSSVGRRGRPAWTSPNRTFGMPFLHRSIRVGTD
jgi:hypothetical protein